MGEKEEGETLHWRLQRPGRAKYSRGTNDQKLQSVFSPMPDRSAASRPPFVLLTMVNILHTKNPHLIQEDPLYPSKTGPTKLSYKHTERCCLHAGERRSVASKKGPLFYTFFPEPTTKTPAIGGGGGGTRAIGGSGGSGAGV